MLPPFYQYNDATTHLERLVSQSLEPDDKEDPAKLPQLVNANLELYSIIEYQEPRCWKLSSVDSETGVPEPVMLRMVGAISDLHLAPIPKPASQQAMERMRPHLKQAIALTGLSSESFCPNHTKIEELYVMFMGALPAKSMLPWQPSYEGRLSVINMHNRIFTKRLLVPNRPREPFHHQVDPHGHLEAMQNDMRFIHTSDNRVDFYGQERGTQNTTYTDPTNFRPGDFIEVTVEFVAFPVVDNKYIFVITLRAVKMLTSEHRTHAAILEMRSSYKTPFGPGFEKKRKELYAVADVDGAGDQLKRLRVTDSGADEHEEVQQPQGGHQPQGEQESGEGGVMNVSDISRDP